MHMMNAVIGLSALVILTILLLLSVLGGRRYGQRQISSKTQSKLEIVTVAEGAVFALLGLLIAFTFSGAYERFEARKVHIIEESNAFETAYLRVDLLAPHTQGDLRANISEYLENHLKIYNEIPFPRDEDLKKSDELKIKIWNQAVKASNMKENLWVGQLVIPAMNAMFDSVFDGYAMTRNHPPIVIYLLLVGLAILGGVLVGYTTAKSTNRHSIHVLSYVILTAFTIYIILDIELPRTGLIRVNSFDHILMMVKDGFKSYNPPHENINR